jgi:hypothetical protein
MKASSGSAAIRELGLYQCGALCWKAQQKKKLVGAMGEIESKAVKMKNSILPNGRAENDDDGGR